MSKGGRQSLSGREWATYRRLISYALPYKQRLAFGTLFGIVYGSSIAGMLYTLKGAFARIFDPSFPMSVAISATIALPLLALIFCAAGYFSVYFINWVGHRVVMDLRLKMFEHINRLSMLYFTRSKTGELISRVTNDTMQIERSVSVLIADVVREPFALLGSVGYLFWLDARLALGSLVLFPICILPVALFGRRVRRFAREGQQKLADMVSIIQETTTGARIVKAYGMENREIARFNEQARSVFGRVMKVTRSNASIDPIVTFISVVGLSLVLLYAKWSGMTFDEFSTFGAALILLYQPVKKMSKLHLSIQQGSASADRIFELLDTPAEIVDAPNAIEFDEPVKTVEFDNVTFKYGDEPVLSGVSLKANAGQCFALVGSSGAGKTTLVSLIPRFYDIAGGRILINGRDIRGFTLSSLRRLIGLVTQDTILFNDTIASNIAYGEPGASMEKIQEAARQAHAHHFIMEMPEGYNTVVGERGVRLSGGQCQRLSIARAILRNPPILILDEATSALDTESERQVQAALDELMANRTVFAIAHRLSTIMHADAILVMEKGEVVERGSHQELLDIGGCYKRLYDLQFKDSDVVVSAASVESV